MKDSERTFTGKAVAKPLHCTILGIIAILFGLFFIFMMLMNKPIRRSEAETYTGTLKSWDITEDYITLNFEDEKYFDIDASAVPNGFENEIEVLDKGTTLYLTINPNIDLVIELKTDKYELLNLDETQAEIYGNSLLYTVLAGFIIIAGVLLIILAIGQKRYNAKENEKEAKRVNISNGYNFDTPPLRRADMTARHRVLLSTTVDAYEICYRRIKSVNELVINGIVYDEKKGIIEFSHRLHADIDGNSIDAGFDGANSYISFNDEVIEEKPRIL